MSALTYKLIKKDSKVKNQDELDYENHIVEYDKQYLDNSNAQE